MVIEALPGTTLKVVQTDFVLQLSVRQLTSPAALVHLHQTRKWSVFGQVADVIFAFLSPALFPNNPGGLPRKVLALRVLLSIGETHAHGGKAS
nr:hypothetical protein [Deinococcus hopiensis]